MELIPGLSFLVRHFLAVLLTVIGIVFILSMYFLYDPLRGTTPVVKLSGFRDLGMNEEKRNNKGVLSVREMEERKIESLKADLVSLSFYLSSIKNSETRLAIKTDIPILHKNIQVEVLQRSGEYFRSAANQDAINELCSLDMKLREAEFLILEDFSAIDFSRTQLQYNTAFFINFFKYLSYLLSGQISQPVQSFNSIFHVIHFNTFSQSLDTSLGFTTCSLFDQRQVTILKNSSIIPSKLYKFIPFRDYQVLLPGYGLFLLTGLSNTTTQILVRTPNENRQILIDFSNDQKEMEAKLTTDWGRRLVQTVEDKDDLGKLVEKMRRTQVYVTDNERNIMGLPVLATSTKVVEVVSGARGETGVEEMCKICGLEYWRFRAGRNWTIEDLIKYLDLIPEDPIVS